MSRRYSRFVGAMRVLLPASGLVLIALVFGWPYLLGDGGRLIAPLKVESAEIEGQAMRMVRPSYIGTSGDREPYRVTADSALLDPREPDRIVLDALAAQVDADGRELLLEAKEGIYRRDAERLALDGGIVVTSADGYRFLTERADVDLGTGSLVGDRPVSGDGPRGSLQADRFTVDDGGNVMRFDGRVKVTLHPQQREAVR